ncbi:hypothetical protein HMPREF3066_06255 [Neisseria sp. HMSC03D10]|nr:hypothetical protein HMPREF3066_06255 [Neisseria sp. HMSC03D10]
MSLRDADQPPSGGCVLKLIIMQKFYKFIKPAAFRRLCVETHKTGKGNTSRISSRLQAAVC